MTPLLPRNPYKPRAPCSASASRFRPVRRRISVPSLERSHARRVVAASVSVIKMALVTVRPSAPDIAIANAIAAHTTPRIEKAADVLTWGADEHILVALTLAWWIYARRRPSGERRAADHVMLTTLVASVMPHLLKTVFDQERPDRLTVRGHERGVPFSGKRLDAFPSGHAMHVGALASAASILPGRQRNTVWLVGAALVTTRVVLLAHWASDVVAGLAIGAILERLLRRFTGYGETCTRFQTPQDRKALTP
jgi:membrane-associated phospholipid phosphatase